MTSMKNFITKLIRLSGGVCIKSDHEE